MASSFASPVVFNSVAIVFYQGLSLQIETMSIWQPVRACMLDFEMPLINITGWTPVTKNALQDGQQREVFIFLETSRFSMVVHHASLGLLSFACRHEGNGTWSTEGLHMATPEELRASFGIEVPGVKQSAGCGCGSFDRQIL